MSILKKFCIFFYGCIALVFFAGCESIADLTGTSTWVDLGRPFPPTELLWVRSGFTKTDTKNEMIDCSKYLKSHPELNTYVLMTNVVDTCMLKKGFKFVPRPKGWMNVCPSIVFSETIGCKSARGKVFIEPDETAKQIKPSGKPDIEVGYIECRRSKPRYEAAYCECSIPGSEVGSCDHLLKYEYPWIEKSGVALPADPKGVPLVTSTDPSSKLQDQMQKDSNAQMNQLLQGTGVRK